MRIVLIAFFFTLTMSAQNCEKLTEIRQIFQVGVHNQQQLEDMIAICKTSNCTKITPYHAAANMRKAEFVWSPFQKLSNFNKGKKMLETFISNNPKNIEARYIRWLTQKMAPKFLGYHNNIDKDYTYIVTNISKSDIDKSYQKIMLAHLQKIKNE